MHITAIAVLCGVAYAFEVFVSIQAISAIYNIILSGIPEFYNQLMSECLSATEKETKQLNHFKWISILNMIRALAKRRKQNWIYTMCCWVFVVSYAAESAIGGEWKQRKY